jgi:polyhydroxyalkanoate synthesis repressor PhaR
LAANDPPTSDTPPRIIKRYTNRKLYDTDESRYVTLPEIAEMVKDGHDVRIIDNRSKEDLTSVTLAQIIYEEEKRSSGTPLFVLKGMIRHGGDKLHSLLSELNPKVTAIRAEAEHAVAKVFRREKDGDVHAGPKAASENKRHPIDQTMEFVRTSRQTLEEWQRTLDEKLHRAMKTVVGMPSLHREVQALREKLAELERKLLEHEEGE